MRRYLLILFLLIPLYGAGPMFTQQACIMPVQSGGGGAAFTKVAAATAGNSSATSITVSKPTGTAENDIMIAIISHKIHSEDSTNAGWTKITQSPYRANYDEELWFKVATGAEGASYTWSGFSTATRIRGTIVTYRGGFNTADPIDTYSATLYNTWDTTLRAAGVTVSAADSPLIIIGSAYNTAATNCTAPASPGTFTEDYDNYDANADYGHYIYSQTITSGATGNIDATLSAGLGTEKMAFALALNPE